MPDVSIRDQTDSSVGEDLRRRDFFLLGPLAGAACLSSIQDLAAKGPEPEDPSACSVAYWKSATERLVKPESLWSGDRDLGDGEIRLTVHGIGAGRDEWIDSGIESCSIAVRFRSDAGLGLPFRVWELDNRQVLNVGSPISISVPVTGGLGLRLGVRLLRSESDDPVHETEFCFLPGLALGRSKLRRGVYCLAVGRKGSTPNWDNYRFRTDTPDGSVAGLEHFVQRSGQPADFPYVVFSVDAPRRL